MAALTSSKANTIHAAQQSDINIIGQIEEFEVEVAIEREMQKGHVNIGL